MYNIINTSIMTRFFYIFFLLVATSFVCSAQDDNTHGHDEYLHEEYDNETGGSDFNTTDGGTIGHFNFSNPSLSVYVKFDKSDVKKYSVYPKSTMGVYREVARKFAFVRDGILSGSIEVKCNDKYINYPDSTIYYEYYYFEANLYTGVNSFR